MIVLGESRKDIIAKIDFTSAIIKLMAGEFVHDDLDFRFQGLAYSLEKEMCPEGVDVIPIWEDNLSITGFYLEENVPVFIKYYLEDMEPIEIGRSVSDLVEHLVTEYGENEKELRDILST